jgi:predicted enzyme related to lactoylglutathione lyase
MATRKRAKSTSRPRTKRAARTPRRTSRPATTRRTAARSTSRPRAGTDSGASFASAIGAVHQHMDFTTHALEDMKRFYTEQLGFLSFQFDPAFQYLSVRTGPSSSLGFMPPMPGPPEQWRPPREPVIYLHVRDVDRAYRDLKAKGVTFQQEPKDMPWNHRVAILRDPEGRMVMLAQLSSR